MKLGDIYEFIVRKGIENDPRSKKGIKDELNKASREYRSLKGEDKIYFDKERLKHPYADTRILYGDKEKDIRTVMVGIDVGGEELLTAYLLNEKGADIDLAMSHHPSGKALAGLYRVMSMHVDILRHFGISPDVAKLFMKERIEEVSRRFMPINHERNVDTARLLGIPFMCAHTPADNHVANYLQKMFDKKKPKKVREVLGLLKRIPEYRDALAKGAGPCLIGGKEDNKAGKVFVDMAGGTEGTQKVFGRLSQAGVGTIVGMHFSEQHFKAAKAELINVIVAGHIASDAIGLNLLLDQLCEKGNLNVVPCSGFTRVKR